MKYEYVISGSTRAFTTAEILKKNSQIYYQMFGKFRSLLSNKSSVAWLYNGYTEEKTGSHLDMLFGDQAKYYVDSGGLQMITLGKTITEELKQSVYKNQAEWADYAMSFDEIPLKLLSKASRFHDTNSRIVDTENFDQYALRSANNLKTQIQYFIESKSTAKPFMILQGYDLQSYQRWADILLSVLSDEEIQHIGGVSCGAAALGQGELEDFKRAFICSAIDLPPHIKSHIHLLGVGNIARLIPYIILNKNGALNCDTLSFDSTTHASAFSLCKYQRSHKILSFSGLNPRGFDSVVDELDIFYRQIGVIQPKEMIKEGYLLSTAQLVEKHGDEYRETYQLQKFANLFCNVKNFLDALELLDNDISVLEDWYGSSAKKYLSFLDVTNEDKFIKWQSLNRSSLKSKAVPVNVSTIGDFFA